MKMNKETCSNYDNWAKIHNFNYMYVVFGLKGFALALLTPKFSIDINSNVLSALLEFVCVNSP